MQYKQGNIFDQPEVTFVPEKEVSFTVPFNKGFENNENLQAEREHFHGQALWVYNELMKGREISGLIAWNENKIMDLRARKYSLKKAGVELSQKKIEKGHGSIAIFMTPEQIKSNREKFKC